MSHVKATMPLFVKPSVRATISMVPLLSRSAIAGVAVSRTRGIKSSVSSSLHVWPFRMRITPPPVPSALSDPPILSVVTTMISAAVIEFTGRSATSGDTSTLLDVGRGSVAAGPFHSHCRSGANAPIDAFVLHIVLTGRLPPETQTGSLLPSMRQPAPQQYWSLLHVSCIGSHGPPFGLHTPPVMPIGAFTQI